MAIGLGSTGIEGNAPTVASTSGTSPASYVVAAHDSSPSAKAAANFVCSGTNDDVLINKVIDSLTNGGTVNFMTGTYNLGSNILIDRDWVTLRGEGNQHWGQYITGFGQTTYPASFPIVQQSSTGGPGGAKFVQNVNNTNQNGIVIGQTFSKMHGAVGTPTMTITVTSNTATESDFLEISSTAISGSPVTLTISAAAADSTTTAAGKIATAINGNAALTAAGLVAANNGTNVCTITSPANLVQQPGYVILTTTNVWSGANGANNGDTRHKGISIEKLYLSGPGDQNYQQTVTVTGSGFSAASGTVVFTTSALLGSPVTVNVAVLGADTVNTIAARMAVNINANTALAAAGITATSALGVCTISVLPTTVPLPGIVATGAGSATFTAAQQKLASAAYGTGTAISDAYVIPSGTGATSYFSGLGTKGNTDIARITECTIMGWNNAIDIGWDTGHILDNNIQNINGYGLLTTGNENIIRGNLIYDSAGPGIWLFSSAQETSNSETLGAGGHMISSNFIGDIASDWGISVINTATSGQLNNLVISDVSITGNTIAGCDKGCILLGYCNNCIVTGNALEKTGGSFAQANGHGIQLGNASPSRTATNNVITGNIINEGGSTSQTGFAINFVGSSTNNIITNNIIRGNWNAGAPDPNISTWSIVNTGLALASPNTISHNAGQISGAGADDIWRSGPVIVNFAATAGSDFQFPMLLPAGAIGYRLLNMKTYGAGATLNSQVVSLWTAAGATGTQIIASATIPVTTATQTSSGSMAITLPASTISDVTANLGSTLFLHVTTSNSGSSLANVMLQYEPNF